MGLEVEGFLSGALEGGAEFGGGGAPAFAGEFAVGVWGAVEGAHGLFDGEGAGATAGVEEGAGGVGEGDGEDGGG